MIGTIAVVNCVQSHPFDCAIATSGIDNTIKVTFMDIVLISLMLFECSDPCLKSLEILPFHNSLYSLFCQFWTPCARVPSMVAGGESGPDTADSLQVMADNQSSMRRHREIGL